MRDLDEPRQYPKRCPKCFHFPEFCRCPKEALVIPIRVVTPKKEHGPLCRCRVNAARFN